jgi:2-dehydro-3-deoxyphosphogluconate aldolase/(4S)-4-hydroxy-2-oxoglutarate aldolase
MVDRSEALARLCRNGVVAVVRADSGEHLVDAAEALVAGGVDCVEITLTTPDALRVIELCRAKLGDAALVGAGSVLKAATARQAIQAGAQFIVSPVLDLAVVRVTHRHGLVCVPGAFTPTEILAATAAGADMVKVFPATRLGPEFFREILAPMPHLKLTPTGGVTLQTAGEFIRAGACTLGVGSALVSRQLLADREYAGLTAMARQFVQAVAAARAGR